MSDTIAPDPVVPRPRRATEATGATEASEGANTGEGRDSTENRGIRGNRGGAVGAGPGAAAKRGRLTKADKLEDKLGMALASVAVAFSMAGDDYSAKIVSARSPQLASSLVELAQENPKVRRVLERMMEGGAWGGVALASASIIIPILSHHGLLPHRVGDPFSGFLPGPDAPARSSASPRGRGGGPKAWTWSKSPEGPAPASPQSDPVSEAESLAPDPGVRDAPPAYQPGSPPGVVTVASGTAAHTSG